MGMIHVFLIHPAVMTSFSFYCKLITGVLSIYDCWECFVVFSPEPKGGRSCNSKDSSLK